MASNLDRYRKDLEALISLGDRMLLDLQLRHLRENGQLQKEQMAAAKEIEGTFEKEYQRWCTEAYSVVRQLLPDRSGEFDYLYKGDNKRKPIIITTYTITIQDWLNGVRAGTDTLSGRKLFDDFAAIVMRFNTQLAVLKATESDSSR